MICPRIPKWAFSAFPPLSCIGTHATGPSDSRDSPVLSEPLL